MIGAVSERGVTTGPVIDLGQKFIVFIKELGVFLYTLALFGNSNEVVLSVTVVLHKGLVLRMEQLELNFGTCQL